MVDAETDGKRQQRRARHIAGDTKNSLGGASFIDDPMLQGGCNQQAERGDHQQQCDRDEGSREPAQLAERFLKDALELEAKQNLGAEDEEASLIERGLELLL